MRRKEKGFSLISLAVSIAISAIIAYGAGMTAIQVIKGTERNNDHAKVTQQARNLSRWFGRDSLMAENITAGDDLGTGDDEFITIYWKDWESGDTFDVRYVWLVDADSLKQMKRKQVVRDKDSIVIGSSATLMANGIYSASISQQGNMWILSLETRSGQKSSIREYRTASRLN